MAQKTFSLSAHKSQVERRRRKRVRDEMQKQAKEMASQNNIVAYAIVGLSDDGRAFAAWDTGGVVPMWAMPHTVAELLRADMEQSGVEEDFRKPLIDRAWKGSR
jgi:hypothetical protein